MEYGMTNDAVKQLCKDVIIVAFHEVTVEESRAIGNIDTALEDKKGKNENKFKYNNF